MKKEYEMIDYEYFSIWNEEYICNMFLLIIL